jgi:hypothetical protein
MELSMHAAAAGVLGGAAFLADVAAPGLGPLVDLGLGAAVAAVAVDAVLTRADPALPPHRAVAASVRAAGRFDTPAAALLGLACDLIDGRVSPGNAARLAWTSACRFVGRHAVDLMPVVGTAARALASGRSAREAARFVAALEAAAEKLGDTPAAPALALAA